MPSRYFENLPHLFYANTYCKDLSRRVVAVDTRTHTPSIFYPYELQNELRSDQLSEFYFDDSDLDWLIYHSNEIIDPYYQWYLNERNFNNTVIDKYGSLDRSQKLIKHYINNWAIDDTELSTSFYNNNLNHLFKKYWRPNFGPRGSIVSYRRREDDSTMNTNRILQYTISANNGSNSFAVGELVDIRVGALDAGTGEVCAANTTTVTLKNVTGNTSANSTDIKFVVGETSAANISTNAVTTVYENITTEEGAYWTAIYFYDEEQRTNEGRKHIYLPDLSSVDYIVDTFSDQLNRDTVFDTRLPIE